MQFRALFLLALGVAGCGDGEVTGTGGRDGGPGPIGDGASPGVDGGVPPGDGGGGPPPDPACTDGSPVDSSALSFDGTDDRISMGVGPGLGLAELTVEAWVRREGRGVSAGTGVGGLQLIPIAGKGRGEGDGSNIDCNYAFGFFGDVLGADFEDMASGANHPAIGVTAIPWGEWHHVAATYDGTSWRLYVDGRLDATADTGGAMPRADSIQHFGIGTAYDSMGNPAGAFHGAIDEVRVWNHARSETEIAGARFDTIETDTGLVGHWALDEGEALAVDTALGNDGAIDGTMPVTPGAVTGVGTPPVVMATAPDDVASIAGTSVELAVSITDDASTAFAVTFHIREITDEDDFTIAVMPDTQYYTQEGDGLEHHFEDQTQWIMDNREAYRIAGVIHNGDVVDDGDRFVYEWNVADRAMSTLEETSAELPDGMPYGIAVGNHDQTPNGTPNNTMSFNRFFGVDRFAGRAYYGGHYGDDNDESWVTFSGGGMDFLVVTLQYDPDADPAVLAWARRIFEAHPTHFGILNSHFLVTLAGNHGAQGAASYRALRDVQNLHIFTSGHVAGEARREDTFEGHTIQSMLADYQGRTMGGNGWMRLWELSPANDEITVRTYSPSLDRFETDADSEFTIPMSLRGAGGAFTDLTTVDPAGPTATATWTGLEAGRIYEWYATVTDCAHEVSTPVRRFTTSP